MLAIRPCRSLCDWGPSDASPARRPNDGPPLFACRGCGSEWEPGQAWAPRQADGSWPPGVREAVADHRPAR